MPGRETGIAKYKSGKRTRLIAAVLPCLIAQGAVADSGAGSGFSQGTAFNRKGVDPVLEPDSRGMSLLLPESSRAPGGRLYELPYGMRLTAPLAGDWNYGLSMELGAVSGSGTAPRIRNYGDYRGGATLNYFNLGLDQAATARYFDVTAGAAGREDPYFRANFGRYGDFRTSLYFSQTPKLFTDQARTVFQGAGSGNLTLPAGFTPGNNSAAQIAAGRVIGWFQGRMEWGARALGNRSIVADPRRADMREIINTRIKFRERFRPFAPSIAEEALDEYFVGAVPDPFMLQVYPVRPDKRSVVPAITHVDGSGRLQTVSPRSNPRYWNLIKAFERTSGVPMLLNTSFNENEPIVLSRGSCWRGTPTWPASLPRRSAVPRASPRLPRARPSRRRGARHPRLPRRHRRAQGAA